MNKKNKVPFFASLQVKYALSYFVIFAVVLVLLNTYPLMASQELLFTSKRDSLKSQTAVMASALMELESLSAEQVARVMNMLDSMGTTRILVTDPAGLILYDSTRQPGEGEEDSSNGEAEYRYAHRLPGHGHRRHLHPGGGPGPGAAAGQLTAESAHHLPGDRGGNSGYVHLLL